jgi:hypothetical protein
VTEDTSLWDRCRRGASEGRCPICDLSVSTDTPSGRGSAQRWAMIYRLDELGYVSGRKAIVHKWCWRTAEQLANAERMLWRVNPDNHPPGRADFFR